MATTNIQKPRMTVGDLAAEHALRAQSKKQQLQVSSLLPVWQQAGSS